MKKIYKIVLALLAITALERFCYFQTGGFRLEKIASDTSFIPSQALPSSEPESEPESEQGQNVRQLLKQPFYYLGSGVQCYAFLSQDGTTVLKVFKHYHMWPSTRALKSSFLPQPWIQKTLEERKLRMHSILESCRIAGRDYSQETGVIYTHLDPTDTFHASLKLVDKIGIAHCIDLDTTEFVLQKKAELVFSYLDSLVKKQDIVGVKRGLDSMLDLLAKRRAKGIVNQDPIVYRNFGFVDGKAVEIDIGSFKKEVHKKHRYQREVFFESLELKEWTEKNCPELSFYLAEKITQLINNESSY